MKNNLSIFGVIRNDDENLLEIVLSIFKKIGCTVAAKQVAGCYRIKGNNNNIIIVKMNDYDLKQKILKQKTTKEIKAGEVSNFNSDAAMSTIYINNHVTPFFGKLLQESRRAAKDGRIHSCWLNSFGCQLKFEENGTHHNYRTVDQLKNMIETKKQKSNERFS